MMEFGSPLFAHFDSGEIDQATEQEIQIKKLGTRLDKLMRKDVTPVRYDADIWDILVACVPLTFREVTGHIIEGVVSPPFAPFSPKPNDKSTPLGELAATDSLFDKPPPQYEARLAMVTSKPSSIQRREEEVPDTSKLFLITVASKAGPVVVNHRTSKVGLLQTDHGESVLFRIGPPRPGAEEYGEIDLGQDGDQELDLYPGEGRELDLEPQEDGSIAMPNFTIIPLFGVDSYALIQLFNDGAEKLKITRKEHRRFLQ